MAWPDPCHTATQAATHPIPIYPASPHLPPPGSCPGPEPAAAGGNASRRLSLRVYLEPGQDPGSLLEPCEPRNTGGLSRSPLGSSPNSPAPAAAATATASCKAGDADADAATAQAGGHDDPRVPHRPPPPRRDLSYTSVGAAFADEGEPCMPPYSQHQLDSLGSMELLLDSSAYPDTPTACCSSNGGAGGVGVEDGGASDSGGEPAGKGGVGGAPSLLRSALEGSSRHGRGYAPAYTPAYAPSSSSAAALLQQPSLGQLVESCAHGDGASAAKAPPVLPPGGTGWTGTAAEWRRAAAASPLVRKSLLSDAVNGGGVGGVESGSVGSAGSGSGQRPRLLVSEPYLVPGGAGAAGWRPKSVTSSVNSGSEMGMLARGCAGGGSGVGGGSGSGAGAGVAGASPSSALFGSGGEVVYKQWHGNVSVLFAGGWVGG